MLHDWIINHTHLFYLPQQMTVLRFALLDKNENKSAPKLLLKIYVREIHNYMV